MGGQASTPEVLGKVGEPCTYDRAAEASLNDYYRRYAGKSWASAPGGIYYADSKAEAEAKGPPATGGKKSSKLVEYGQGVYSRAKEDLIRGIAKDVLPLLGRKVDSSASIDKLVGALKEAVPDPRKKKRVKRRPDIQIKICRKAAESINKHWGTPLIDLSIDERSICDQVAEVIHTLVVGMHSEFLSVAGDVKNIAENMGVLETLLMSMHDSLVDRIKECGDEFSDIAIENAHELYDRLIKELRRQTALLTNIVSDSVPRFEDDIVELVRESGALKETVAHISDALGTKEFGQKLGYLLAGMDNVAQAALLVDKALKKVGMSLKDWQEAKTISELREKLYKTATGKGRSLAPKELSDFMKAEQILFTNSGELNKEEIVKYLKSNKIRGGMGGGQMTTGGQDHIGPFKTWGEKNKSLKSRLKTHKTYRKRLFNDFEKQLLKYFDKIVSVVHDIAPKIGSEIPVTHDLRVFERAFGLLEVADRKNLNVALSGYKTDPRSKDYKNRFMAALDVLHQTLQPLTRGPGGASFKKLESSVADLHKLVDTFSRTFLESLIDPISDNPQDPEEQKRRAEKRRYKYKIGGALADEAVQMAVSDQVAELSKSIGGALEDEAVKMAVAQEIASATGGALADEAVKMAVAQEIASATGGALADEAVKMAVAQEIAEATGGALADEAVKMAVAQEIAEATGGVSQEAMKLVEIAASPVSGGSIVKQLTGDLQSIVAESAAVGGIEKYVSLKAARGELRYYTRIASLKKSLKRAGYETERAGVDYKDLLGKAVAQVINKEQADCNNHITILKKLSEGKVAGAGIPALENNDPVNRLSILIRAATAAADANTLKDAASAAEGMMYVYKRQCESKKRFLEVLENMDLLLSSFTEGVQTHPDDVLVLKKILDQLVNVKKFFTKRSGDLLVEVFETFPGGAAAPAAPGGAAVVTWPVGAYPLPDQVIPAADAGVAGVLGTIHTDEEKQAKAFDQALRTQHYYEQLAAPGSIDIGNPENGIFIDSPEKAELLYKRIEKALLGVRSLENLLATFSKLGSRFAGKNIDSKSFMNYGQMYKALNEYLICSSVGYTWQVVPGAPVRDQLMSICRVTLLDSEQPEDRPGAAVPPPPIPKGDWDDRFHETDKYFVLFLKAMIAKIFAVLGLYTIFNKPDFAQMSLMNLSLSPTRTILGGAEMSTPKIIPDAVELYVRLPLLAEWYRDTVGMNRFQTPPVIPPVKEYEGDGMMIAFIPEIAGPWAPFIDLIFNRVDYVQEGTYSETDVKIMVAEINKLYHLYKKRDHKDTMYSACMGLVKTINDRYGLLKKSDAKAYVESKRSGARFAAEPYPVEDEFIRDNVDFDILDAKEQYGRRTAPSDRYIKYAPIDITKREMWSEDVRLAVVNFRKALNMGFEDWIQQYARVIDPAHIGVTISFDETIRQHKGEIAMASTEDSKYNVVRRAIRGVGRFSSVGFDKLIMFHETVASPLVSLCELKSVLLNFEREIKAIPVAFGVNPAQGVQRFIEQIYSISSYTNKVKMNITTGQTKSIILDFSELKDLVGEILNSVKLSISKFRLQLDKEYIQKFTSAQLIYQGAPVDNNISVFKIEDSLYNTLLEGRNYIQDGDQRHTGLEALNNTIVRIMALIGRVGPNALGDAMQTLCYWNQGEQAGGVCLEIVDRSDSNFPFNILPHAELPDGSRSKVLDGLEAKMAGHNATALGADADFKTAYDQLDSMGGFFIQSIRNWYSRNPHSDSLLRLPQCQMGLLMQFNQILAKYVQQFYDGGTRKFYGPLISDFASGAYSNAVMEGVALDDLSNVNGIVPNAGNTATIAGDPKDGVVIYASIARAMKVLLVRQTAEGKPFYRADSLTELQEYYVENLKTNLPAFIKLFEIVNDRACLLKQLLTETSIGEKVGRGAAGPPSPAAIIIPNLTVGYIAADTTVDGYRTYLSNMLDQIRSAAASIKHCASKVYKELNDTPLFMETYHNFFANYRINTGRYPLTLLSNLQVAMFDPASPTVMNAVAYSKLLPLYHGSNEYAKYNRGIRGTINGDKASLDYLPGFVGLVDRYNALLQGDSRFDKASVSAVVDGQVTIARYLANVKHYKSQLVVSRDANLANVGLNYTDCEFAHDDLKQFDNNIAGLAVPTRPATANAYFEPYIIDSIGPNHDQFAKLLFLIENEECGRNNEVVVNYLSKGYKNMRELEGSTQDRANTRFLNLVDLDIAPINVHVLEREIPLINIMNYAFSFDQLLIHIFNLRNITEGTYSLIAPTTGNFTGPTAYADAINPFRSENSMVTTLANPYMRVEDTPPPPLPFGMPVEANAGYGTAEELFLRYIGRIMSGGMGIEGFERPKYLSDQIWNKVLLQEIHPTNWSRPDAQGPFASWWSFNNDPTTNIVQAPQYVPSPNLTYYKEYVGPPDLFSGKGASTKLKQVDVGAGTKRALQQAGRTTRYDTKLVRNIVWFTQLQRVVRWYLRQALKGRPHPLVYDYQVANMDNTEYYANQTYDIGEYEPFVRFGQ